ncbi:hypothetical protein GCM10009850_047670 [Nonomuraea monospora]|uniref:Minor tail protein n=1 Tax=Nonomuraea monospora TaxID=568818 RepID=A0ABP5PCD6_9ACTN
MARIFTIPWTGTITNTGGNADLWEVLPGDDYPIRVRGVRLGQTSELGDTAEESLRISIVRMGATITSSNGTAGAPETVGRPDQTPAFTCETNGATVATTTGTTDILEEMSWNIRNSPFEIWYPDPDFAPTAIQGEGLFVRLQSTVADDITFAGTLWVQEG